MAEKEDQQMNYLNNFLDKDGTNPSNNPPNKPPVEEQVMEEDYSSGMKYINVDLSALPLGMFYKRGTQIKIRAATVSEIQNYSSIQDQNIIDVTEKLNQLLSSCVKVELPGGQKASYKYVKDGDRMFLIFMIRELTFQQGSTLAKDVICKDCNHEFQIPYRSTTNAEHPKTFVVHEMPEKLQKFYNSDLKAYEFNINGVSYKIAPPTIGIQETFFDDIKGKVQQDKNPNVAFMKIIPFLLWDRVTITEEGIKKWEQDFKRMDMKTFQIIDKIIDNMVFGIKELKMLCPKCGEEVHTEMTFPGGASSLFNPDTVFEDFINQ